MVARHSTSKFAWVPLIRELTFASRSRHGTSGSELVSLHVVSLSAMVWCEAGPVEDGKAAAALGGRRHTSAPGKQRQDRDNSKERPRVLSQVHQRILLRTR